MLFRTAGIKVHLGHLQRLCLALQRGRQALACAFRHVEIGTPQAKKNEISMSIGMFLKYLNVPIYLRHA